jgi:hypothetical protein
LADRQSNRKHLYTTFHADKQCKISGVFGRAGQTGPARYADETNLCTHSGDEMWLRSCEFAEDFLAFLRGSSRYLDRNARGIFALQTIWNDCYRQGIVSERLESSINSAA